MAISYKRLLISINIRRYKNAYFRKSKGITEYNFMKKFKDKKFAAKCNREVIKQGCEMGI